MFKVSQIAVEMGVTPQTIYTKIKALGDEIKGHLGKEGNATTLTDEGYRILKEYIEKQNSKLIEPKIIQSKGIVFIKARTRRLSKSDKDKEIAALKGQIDELKELNKKLTDTVVSLSSTVQAQGTALAESSQKIALLESATPKEDTPKGFFAKVKYIFGR